MIPLVPDNFALWTAVGIRHELSLSLSQSDVPDTMTVSDCFERVKTDSQAIRILSSS